MPIQTHVPPGTLIERVVIDTDTNIVEINYNLNPEKSYGRYTSIDAEYFQLQLVAEYANVDIDSVSRFIDKNIADGDLEIIFEELVESPVEEEIITVSGDL